MLNSSKNNINFKNNCINTIRLLAALNVIFRHLVNNLLLQPIPIISTLFELFPGVQIFFFLSGYLIWNSVKKADNPKVYFKNRFLRIYPELWIAIILSLISIFIFLSTVNLLDIALFTLAQGTFLQFWTPDSLREFGIGTPNGALWTICVIIQFYIVIYLIKKIFINRKKTFWIATIFVSILINIITPFLYGIVPTIFYKLFTQTLIPYFWLFIIGAFISEYFNEIIPFIKKWWWCFLIILIITIILPDFNIGRYPTIYSLSSCLCCLGFAYSFPNLNIKYDISYGLYVYHMVIINILIELNSKNKIINIIITLITSFMLATISYIFMNHINKKYKSIQIKT